MPICRIDELPSKGATGRSVTDGTNTHSIIVVNDQGRIRAYLNSCPHTGVRLDWREDDFYDVSDTYLMCAMHGALFEPDTGRCVDGPCAGRSLVEIPTETAGEYLVVVAGNAIPASAHER